MDLFQKNLGALEQHNPVLAAELMNLQDKDVAPDGYTLTVEKTPSGLFSLAAVKDQDTRVLLHSAKDPKREASRMIQSLAPETGESFIVFGFGMGHHLLELLKAVENKFDFCLVLERSPQILRKALENTDLSSALGDARFCIVSGDSLAEFSSALRERVLKVLLGGVRLVDHRPSLSMYSGFYHSATQNVLDMVLHGRTDVQTALLKGSEFQRNIIRNLPASIRATGVSHFEGKFVGRPAIVVAAGPSLDKNIDRLREVQDKAIIICVNTSYQTLREHGVTPHVVMVIDPSDTTLKHFNRTDVVTDSILAFDSECYTEIQSKFAGPKMFVGIKGLRLIHWLEQEIGSIGFLEKGNTVAHTSFYLARMMGCDPIILVGLDLALPAQDGPTHVSGASLRGSYRKDPDDRNRVIISDPHDPSKLQRRKVFWVPGIDAPEVPSLEILYVYLRQFEREFHNTKQTVIDATEGGARKQGTEIKTLSDTIAEYCQNSWDVRQELEACLKPSLPEQQINNLTQGFRTAQTQLNTARESAQRGFRITVSLEEFLNGERTNVKQAERQMAEMNQLLDQMGKHQLALCFLQRYIAGVHFLFSQRLKEGTTPEQKKQRAIEFVKRRKLLFDAIRICSDEAIGLIEEVIPRLTDNEKS